MSVQSMGPLDLDEVKLLRFDFSSESAVSASAILSTPTVTVTAYEGTDANPALVKDGVASISGLTVVQRVKPGLVGVTYKIRVTVVDNSGQVHGITGLLKVVAP